MSDDALKWAGTELHVQRLQDELHRSLRQTRPGRLALLVITVAPQVRQLLRRPWPWRRHG
ncbi:hypothetical protein [Streptomyces sp. NPDC047990]|uniref:hypothetical protein n=1 Tax=Streptomyces sp. NPDC047990 TaxID=3365496 RepID=UPI00371FB545